MMGLREYLMVRSRKFLKFLDKLFALFDISFYWIGRRNFKDFSAKYVFLCQGLNVVPLAENVSEKMEKFGFKVRIITPHLKTVFMYVLGSWCSDLMFFSEKNSKVGILGITTARKKLRSRTVRYFLWVLIAMYFIILLIVNVGVVSFTFQIPREVLGASILIIIFGLIPFGAFVDEFIARSRFLKHSKKIISVIKEAVEEIWPHKLEPMEGLPFSLPEITYEDLTEIKRQLGINE